MNKGSIQCSYCGADWFRTAEVYILPEQRSRVELTGRYGQLTDPLPPEEIAERIKLNRGVRYGSMICLCGAPFRQFEQTSPSSPDAWRQGFASAWDRAGKYLSRIRSGEDSIRRWIDAEKWQKTFSDLRGRLRRLESKVLNILKRIAPEEVQGRRKPWKQIRRKKETKAVGRDQIALDLQNAGRSYRAARQAVEVFFECCARGLRDDGILQTPLGTFWTVPSPPPRTRQRFGGTVTVFQNRRRIRFKAAPDLARKIDRAIETRQMTKEESMKMTPADRDPTAPHGAALCGRCGSSWFMLTEFRQYQSQRNSPQLLPIPGALFLIRICLCGNILAPPSFAATDRHLASFLANVQRAIRYRARIEAIEDIASKIQATLPSTTDLQELSTRLSRAEDDLSNLALT